MVGIVLVVGVLFAVPVPGHIEVVCIVSLNCGSIEGVRDFLLLSHAEVAHEAWRARLLDEGAALRTCVVARRVLAGAEFREQVVLGAGLGHKGRKSQNLL